MNRSAELYRRIDQAGQQATELRNERWALLEVLGRMQADAKAQELRAASMEQQCAALESQLRFDAQRDAQIAEEISELERQASVIRAQTGVATRRVQALNQQVMSLEQALQSSQGDVSFARQSLGGAALRMIRLKYKLGFSDARTGRDE